MHQGIIENNNFIIYNVINKGCILKKIITNNNVNKNIINVFEEVNYKLFLLIEFNVGEKDVYKIELKTDKYNYCIVNNILNKDFFIYYIKYHLPNLSCLINDTDQCSVKLIDYDVKIIYIFFTDKNESILLEKEGCKIQI